MVHYMYPNTKWKFIFLNNHQKHIPYILESNAHPYSFRGLKIRCVLDSQSRAGFWKNDTAPVHAVRTIQYNHLLSWGTGG
jgi:hypothetical protein